METTGQCRGLNEGRLNEAQVRSANTLVPAADSASSNLVHRFTMTSIVLEELLRNKVAKCSPRGLGKAG